MRRSNKYSKIIPNLTTTREVLEVPLHKFQSSQHHILQRAK